MANNELKNFQRNAAKCFDTEAGRQVLAYLKDSYVNGSALGKDANQTYYKLGQQELIKDLISFINSPDILDEIIVNNTSNQDYI